MTSNAAKYSVLFAATLGTAALVGCARQAPVTMAPPMGGGGVPVASAPMMNPGQGQGQGQMAGAPGGNVFNWQDVPQGQQVPVIRATFDQGGYQLFAQSGETIVVPFANQNMYVMKFGKSGSGGMYFVNDGTAPTLYVPNGGYVENAAQQNARWYPFSQNFQYERPVYIGIAPSWSDYVAMGWYPGMNYYGGYWGARPWYPGFGYSPMIGLNFNIGGRPYYGWNSYQSYYRSNPYNRVAPRTVFNYSSVGRNAPSSFGRGRSYGSSGSFGRAGSGSFSGSTTYGRTGNRSFGSGTGSFGTSTRSSGSSGTGSFGSSNRSFGSGSSSFGRSGSGSFGSGSSSSGTRPSFGSGTSGSSGSFGRSGSSGFSGFGSGRSSFGSGTSGFRSPSGGSFGGGSSSFGRSGGSFGGGSSFGRSSGSSFGGGSSFGRSSGSSFGGGRSSFGGGRRR